MDSTGREPLGVRAFDVATIAGLLRESTVHVRSGLHGSGSGVVWRREGIIVTNAHVVTSESATVELVDGRVLAAHVVARDTTRDLAQLAVDDRDLRPAAIRSSESLRVGEVVVAVGNPLGIPGAVTAGIVHAVGKPAREGLGRFGRPRRTRWVHADIRLLPGNSGGPLADARGRVVGINTMIAGGLALAVPSLDVERFLREGSPREWLGVSIQYVPAILDGRSTLGLYVTNVATGSPASRAGIVRGDILVGSRGEYFESSLDLADVLREGRTSGVLYLDIVRRGRVVGIAVRSRAEAA
jgi:serine protease Do